MALRMSGSGPNLGLRVLQGSIGSYSVERDLKMRSDDRGDFILHPEIGKLEQGECAVIQWELFWFDTKESFYEKLLNVPMFPVVFMKQSTYFIGEKMQFEIGVKGTPDEIQIKMMPDGNAVPYTQSEKQGITWISVGHIVEKEGEYRFEYEINGKKSYVLLYGSAALDTLAANRCRFIAKKQQFHITGSPLDGAYLIYDREEESLYYDHKTDDHNGGRERLAMGVLMALWLQKYPDEELENSLGKYVTYVYRELYQRGEGVVYNDIRHNLEWNRMYNYPWMAVLQLELYRLWGKEEYLEDSYHVLKYYYENGGTNFYAIGIPAWELRNELLNIGMIEKAKKIDKFIEAHAEKIYKNSICYPASEVSYEQSIVAPAVGCLIQGYQVTKDKRYLDEAKKQLKILSLFNGRQADYHLFETAIRHWDGFWFGKRRLYGDTFPHYWSCLTGVEYARYTEVTGDDGYTQQAAASLRGCLNLFFQDGSASCAMVFPEKVNGEKAHYYDEWANDQDWALYYALKYRNLTEKV